MSELTLEEMEASACRIADADTNGALCEIQKIMRRSFQAGASARRGPRGLAEDVLGLDPDRWNRFVTALSNGKPGGGYVTSKTNSGHPILALRPLGSENAFVENEFELSARLEGALCGAVGQAKRNLSIGCPEGAFPGMFFVQVLRDLVSPEHSKATP